MLFNLAPPQRGKVTIVGVNRSGFFTVFYPVSLATKSH